MSVLTAINFGSRSSSGSKQRTADTRKVATWIKLSTKNYDVDDSAIEVMVTELECNDPDCVPLETLVALLGKEARWTYKILKPLAEVTQENVNEIPFPPSWSFWVAEQTFRKKHAELFSWMCNAIDDFHHRSIDLEMQDQLMAATIMEKLLLDHRSKTAYGDEEMPVIQDESSQKSNTVNSMTGAQSGPLKATDGISNSTLVIMKPKVPLDTTASVPRTSQYYGEPEVISNEMTCLQTSESFVFVSEALNSTPNSIELSEAVSRPNDDLGTTVKSPNGSCDTNEPKNVENKNMYTQASQLLSPSSASGSLPKRHKKGTRPRGCPCCDPDSIDNMIDKMIFLETPP